MNYKKITTPAVIIIYILLWQFVSMAVGSELLIPAPFTVAKVFFEVAGEKTFYINTGLSILRIIGGFAAAILCGIVLAVITDFVPLLYNFFYPAISAVRATPVVSFIILALLWIKTTYVPVFIAFLMVMPVVWNNISAGIRQSDKKLLEMADVFNMGIWKKIKYIYIPSCVPFFKNCMSSGIGLAWKAGIAAEVICSPHFAIGSRMYDAKIYLETPELFTWTFTVVILSIVIEKIMTKLLNTAFKGY